MRRLTLVLGALICACAHSPKLPPYSYEGPTGPASWGDLSADYAACGHVGTQSPVDVAGVKASDLPKLQPQYGAVASGQGACVALKNTGHTVQAEVIRGVGTA